MNYDNCNFVCLIGVICLYLPLIYNFYSYRALIVFINGILYHSNNKSTILRYNDIFFNIILIVWTNYYYPYTIAIALFSIIAWYTNNYLGEKNRINLITMDIIHVILVQYPLFIGLKKTLLDK